MGRERILKKQVAGRTCGKQEREGKLMKRLLGRT
jgi:hypothetical protein